jgi:hypothetical protein
MLALPAEPAFTSISQTLRHLHVDSFNRRGWALVGNRVLMCSQEGEGLTMSSQQRSRLMPLTNSVLTTHR